MVAHRTICALVLPVLVFLSACAATPEAAPPAAPTSAAAGETTLVAIAPPAAAPHPTLPEFLGLNALGQGLTAGARCLRDKLGDVFPSLKKIPSPDELGPDADPGSEAAAEIQADEAKAGDKVAALQYLAKVGCGCYPGVEEAFLAAMEDCTERVRYEAVKALRTMAGNPCESCRSGSCCSEALTRKLSELANDTDAEGCFVEPSPRVRRLARLALMGCGGTVAAVDGAQTPDEGPSRDDLPPEEPPAEDGAAPETQASAGTAGDTVRPATFEASIESRLRDETVLARVFGEPVFESEILGRIAPRLASLAAGLDKHHRRDLRRSLMRYEMRRAIDRKLLCREARRQLKPDEIAVLIEANLFQRQMPEDGPGEATAEAIREVTLAQAWIDYRAKADIVVTHDELISYYQTYADKFRLPAAVRWERVSVPLDPSAPDESTYEWIETMRKRLRGGTVTDLPAVDIWKVQSKTYGWTRRDEIASETLVHALFSLPIGEVSSVLPDGDQLHLVRVLQRRPEQIIEFQHATDQIRRALIAERKREFAEAYLAELRRGAYVWSIFDHDRSGVVLPGAGSDALPATDPQSLSSVRPLAEGAGDATASDAGF